MQPITCSCEQCRAMCEHSTCLPTPDEARDLIRRGLGDRLATYAFGGQRFVGPAPAGQEGKRDLPMTRTGKPCTFLRDGKCELHGAGKPLEGRIAHHTRPWLPIRQRVMDHWRGRRFDSVSAMLNKG